jgi:glutamate synthase domain-containing protein 2/glutamate synthase domain-containing protein 1/glutamate synthase domain-containing protein 3
MKKQSLVRPGFHDACGVGFIAESSGIPSKRVIDLSFKALELMVHRGATLADNHTGDGTGVLTDIPSLFFRNIFKEITGKNLNKNEQHGIAMVFTSPSEFSLLEDIIKNQTSQLKLQYDGYRKVPINKKIIGEIAFKSCPLIMQFFIRGKNLNKNFFEEQLYILRKLIENELNKKNRKSFICSLSSKTIVYKGLLSASQLKQFYPDLSHPDYKCKVSIFHERFSTNTVSTWSMTQPFRMLAHNGEINTIRGNRLWMKTRELTIKSKKWGNNMKKLLPILGSKGSDSYSLDNILEFLTLSGKGILKSIMMLIPEPYHNIKTMPKELRNFYIYNENFIEPWDGPSALVFTDGEKVVSKLDRNGLRPLRYSITNDGLIVMASEAGVADLDSKDIELHHHMSSGEIFALNLDGTGIIENKKIKQIVSQSEPYSKIIKEELIRIKRKSDKVEFGKFKLPNDGFDTNKRILLGVEQEDLDYFLLPMAKSGREPIGSMGDDTPPALLSKKSRKLYDYFKQAFAQVTNPPIDPIRERDVMSLFKYLGTEDNLLANTPNFHGTIRIESPILSVNDIKILLDNRNNFPISIIKSHFQLNESIQSALKRILKESEIAVNTGCRILVISDEGLNQKELPIPMLLVTSAVHNYLIEKQIRSNTSIICLTGDVIEDHHIACLTGFGASAVYPYMAYELIRENFNDDKWVEALGNYRRGLEKGLLKIMAKIGISTFSSYHGSMLYHGLGLGPKFRKKYFPNIICDIGNLNLKKIKLDILNRIEKLNLQNNSLKLSGRFKYRKSGEKHGYSPNEFLRIQGISKGKPLSDDKNGTPIYLRDLLDFKTVKKPLLIEQIDENKKIIQRFNIGAMSFGALSEEAHRTLTKGSQMVGAHGNTGEGGEHSDRYSLTSPTSIESSHIKQIASGRFGVSTEFLVSAREIQIKMAQGAKPGEGGQLPGHKVTLDIANVRMTTPGVPLISPPPHHDIYSIEDIAQLIYDLKQVNRRAKISVKLVSQPGIGLISCGVVKAGADIILVSGGDGGTGATPLGSMKHTGLPWELGLAEVHQTLISNSLRTQVTLRVDGGLKKGKDIIIGALLGAEEYDFGTSALISIGCVMARKCHKNTCPVGIATQDLKLRKKFKGTPENVSNFLTAISEDVRNHLSKLGFSQLSSIIGRSDLLKTNRKFKNYLTEENLDLSILIPGDDGKKLALKSINKIRVENLYSKLSIDDGIFEEIRQIVMTQGHAVIHRKINNTNRTIGSRLSGEITFLYGQQGFKGNIQCRMTGAAGQSFGAFLINNLELRLKGVANDYVGKGMSGGLITVRSPKIIRKKQGYHTLIGNVALYGATGGRLLVAGRVGERFAVRNSGAAAVVEGLGAHGCEYMTRGTVVILGKIGSNFGAGMTGGIAYIYLKSSRNLNNLNNDYVRDSKLEDTDFNLVWKLIRGHKFHTASIVATKILNNWDIEKNNFVKIIPKALDIIDFEKIYNEQIDNKMGILLNE